MPVDVVPPPDDAPVAAEVRPWHGSFGGGGALLATGKAGGSAWRGEGEVDLEPGGALGKLGGSLALRAADLDHRGLATAGLIYEAGAARPRVTVDLHADIGVDLDAKRPLVGAGVRTVVGVIGPVGIALDSGGYFVIDGVDKSRLVLSGSTALVLRF